MYDISQLSEIQRQIVLDTDGCILVSAGAGSGKTRLLTHRVAYLIREKGVSPFNILAITFTNKATKEMKDRINKMTDCDSVWISTFHSMCAKILRQNIYCLEGFNKFFTIYDDSDREKLIKKICKEYNIDRDLVSTISVNISSAKNMGMEAEEYSKLPSYDKSWGTICDVYKMYDDELKKSNALDFDDLLMKTLKLLRSNERVRSYYQNLFHYILVDEFQDTNTVQYLILKELVGVHNNVFVVGDEDQSIYSWRGANIENIRNFIKDFKDVRVYKLEQNYRSTQNILDCANKLIVHNQARIEKTLFTQNGAGEPVTCRMCRDEKDEGDWVVRKISDLKYAGVDYGDVGILMRINSTSRIFEEKLLNYNIPYHISGGLKFYDRMEIKNVLAYLTLIVNDKDNISLERIINFPRRGIGDASVEKISIIAKQNDISEWEVLNNLKNYDLNKLSSKITPFVTMMKSLKVLSEESGLYEFVNNLVSTVGILDAFNGSSEDDVNRKLNIKELLKSVRDWENDNVGATLSDYLESVTLQNTTEEENVEGGSVTLSTAHAAKGLEFDYVFVVGCEEGIFPLSRSVDNGDVEEERRLMYVAVTRAKKKLFLTLAKSRMLYGCTGNTQTSRFLSEMQVKPSGYQRPSFTENLSNEKGYDYIPKSKTDYSSKMSFGGINKPSINKIQTPPIGNRSTTIPNNELWQAKLASNKKKYDDYKVGLQVLHPKFGIGTILKVEDIDNNPYVTVNFHRIGNKTLALAFAPLQIIKQ